VVGIVEVDVEAALDEHASQPAFGRLGVDAGRPPDVAGSDGDRSRPVDAGRGRHRDGRLEFRIAGPDQPTDPARVGERLGRVDAARGRDSGGDALDGRTPALGLPDRELVVVARQFPADTRPEVAARER